VAIAVWLVGTAAASASIPTTAFRYVYDADGQLKAAISPSTETAFYSWDPVGDLLSLRLKSSKNLSVVELTPAQGPVGETVTIGGTGFSTTKANDTVKFNGTKATVSAATAVLLTVKVPTGATSGAVSVQTTTEGPVLSEQSFVVASASAPSVGSVSASLAASGSEVTVSGSGFESTLLGNDVFVNRTRPEVLSQSSSSIKFRVPEGAGGGRVSVETPHGSATGPVLFIPPVGVSTSQIGSTGEMKVGESKTVTVPTGSADVELLAFEGTARQRVSLLASEETFGVGTVSIMGPEGKKLVEEGTASGESFDIGEPKLYGPVTLPSTGTYTIAVAPAEEYRGSLKLSSSLVSDVKGSLAPTAEGVSTGVSITEPGQRALYTVTGAANESVSLKTSETKFVGGGNLHFEWLNPEGHRIYSEETGPAGNGFFPQVRFPTSGTYTLVVNPANGDTGSMTLTAYNASDVTGTITPTVAGESKVVSIGVPGQFARYTFSGESGQTVTLTATESTISRGSLMVLNPEGGLVSGGETSFAKGGNGSVEPTLSSTGTYTILIEPEGSYTGSVTLTAYLGSHPLVIRRPAGGLVPLVAAMSGTLPDPPRPAEDGASAQGTSELAGAPPSVTGAAITPEMRAFRSAANASADATHSPWRRIAPLYGLPGTTAIAGQVLAEDGLPLAGVHVSLQGTSLVTRTDQAGRFLLARDLPSAHQVLVVAAEGLSGRKRYGSYEMGIEVAPDRTNVLPFTVWLTPLDPAGDMRISSPTTRETRLTTPEVPGLEIRIPAGTVITNRAGHVVHELNLTQVPVERPPFPLPAFVETPIYFTAQPGGAWLSKGAQVIYPNVNHVAPHQAVDFWNYSPHGGWYIYGKGVVSANGKQVIPDPGTRIWEFSGAMWQENPTPSSRGPKSGAGGSGGDPVDLNTGLFVYHKTDLVVPDVIPITVEQVYRQDDTNHHSFGLGMTNAYELQLWGKIDNFQEVWLVLPDGGKVYFTRTSPGASFAGAELVSHTTPGLYYDAKLKYNEDLSGWELTLTDGLTYIFGSLQPLQAIRDRYGDVLTITRERGTEGNITQITSPHGRWVKFSYEGGYISEVRDNAGQSLKYKYRGSGLLEQVTDAAGRVTHYEWNGANQMSAVSDGRGTTYVENEYNAQERVSKEKLANSGTYNFSYTENKSGEVESTTVTDPRSTQRKITYNEEGFPTSETDALGTSIQETTSYEPQKGSGLPLSMTDPLGRKTTYKYNGEGDLAQMTLLAGTSSARTLEYAYEPNTNLLASFTNALKQKTTYHYGEHGELLSVTDPLGHKTSYEYNVEGQPTLIENALGDKTKLSYQFGDLASVTDPLGRTTQQFVDALGHVGSIATPGGQRILYEHNADGQVTKVTDPLGASTSYEYDGDGDLVATTDAQKHKTTATYSPMDLLESETDALEHTAKGVYDEDGNLIELTTRDGKLDKFTYDALNRLTEARYGVSGETAESTIKYEYDLGNRLTKIVDSATGTYTPEYDGFNRLKSIATPTGTITYEYNEADERTSMKVPGQEPVKYSYDEAGRLTEVKRGSETVVLRYDEANRPTSTTLPDGIEEQYGYDEANELTSITYKKGSTKLGELDYAYNSEGLREAMWGSYARLGLPEAISSAVYNADNEQTERNGKKLGYDAEGNLTSDGSSEYKWNARGQLAEITGAIKAAFAYDPFGRRTTKTLGSTTTKLLYDGPNVVQETQGSSTANVLAGLWPNQTFARTTSKTESLLTDALGSTIALGGSTGKAETSYTYDPFGATSKEGTASENPFQYTGQENDGNGLYDYGARYYSPAAARFISQDPLGQEGSGVNLYRYADDSPINATDPYGTSSGGAFGSQPGGCSNQGKGPGGGPGAGGIEEEARCHAYEKTERIEEEVDGIAKAGEEEEQRERRVDAKRRFDQGAEEVWHWVRREATLVPEVDRLRVLERVEPPEPPAVEDIVGKIDDWGFDNIEWDWP
jgi:RHS repeat-associated protein